MAINFLAIVVVGVVVFLALAGAAVYAFLRWIDRDKE
jgi:hypothetical protein